MIGFKQIEFFDHTATGAVLFGVQTLYSNDHRSLRPQSLLAGDVWHNTRYLALAFAATI